MEDEKHFLLDCPAYLDLRTSILGDYIDTNTKPEELIDLLPAVTLTKFIKLASKFREEKLSVVAISLDYLRVTLRVNKPSEERPPGVMSLLEASFSTPGALKFKIRRRKKNVVA